MSLVYISLIFAPTMIMFILNFYINFKESSNKIIFWYILMLVMIVADIAFISQVVSINVEPSFIYFIVMFLFSSTTLMLTVFFYQVNSENVSNKTKKIDGPRNIEETKLEKISEKKSKQDENYEPIIDLASAGGTTVNEVVMEKIISKKVEVEAMPINDK